MIVNAYHHPPRIQFIRNMLLPGIVIFFLFFLIMGHFALSPRIRSMTEKTSHFSSTRFTVSGGVARAAAMQWAQTLEDWMSIPSVCWGERAQNDFQRGQCTFFWNKLALTTAIGFTPLLALLIYLMICLDILAAFYRKVRKKIEAKAQIKIAVVADPPHAPKDIFSWFFCLRTVCVEVAPHQQETVYLPYSQRLPQPGQSLALYDCGKILGVPRLAAQHYAPHIVIISGKR
jgi:hypothetical protein